EVSLGRRAAKLLAEHDHRLAQLVSCLSQRGPSPFDIALGDERDPGQWLHRYRQWMAGISRELWQDSIEHFPAAPEHSRIERPGSQQCVELPVFLRITVVGEEQVQMLHQRAEHRVTGGSPRFEQSFPDS